MKCYLWYIKNKGTKINLKDLESEDTRTRFGALDNLYYTSKKSPKKVYPYINEIIKLLTHENKIFRWRAIDTISELSKVDKDDKIKKILPKLINSLKTGDLITAHHTIDSLAAIALAKPRLQVKITNELIKVSRYKYPTDVCNQYARGRVVTALSKYIDNLSEKEKKLALTYIKKQKENQIASTRKKAESILKIYDKNL